MMLFTFNKRKIIGNRTYGRAWYEAAKATWANNGALPDMTGKVCMVSLIYRPYSINKEVKEISTLYNNVINRLQVQIQD